MGIFETAKSVAESAASCRATERDALVKARAEDEQVVELMRAKIKSLLSDLDGKPALGGHARGMKTFEYKQVSLIERDKVIEVANRLGSSGWELVSVTPVGAHLLALWDLYFKREIAAESLFPAVVLGSHASAPNSACLEH